MNFTQLFNKLTGNAYTLKQSREKVEDIKLQNEIMTHKAVKESVDRSKQAGKKFDRMSTEMNSIADDVAVKIARAAGR